MKRDLNSIIFEGRITGWDVEVSESAGHFLKVSILCRHPIHGDISMMAFANGYVATSTKEKISGYSEARAVGRIVMVDGNATIFAEHIELREPKQVEAADEAE